jgi:predicted phage-related endonuclease
MRWGNILEPLIAQEFAKETGRAYNMAGKLIRSIEHPWMLATLDAEQSAIGREGTGALEIKATGFRAGDWTEGVPAHVFAQVQHQLAVTGYGWASVAVLMFGCRLLWADVERDDAFIAHMIEVEAEFWRRVEAREPVAPDGSAASVAALKLLYPSDTGEVIALPGELIPLDTERVALKAEIATGQKRVDWIDAQIKAAIGDASAGELANGVTYTHRLQKRAAYEVKATEFRVLRRSAKKEK